MASYQWVFVFVAMCAVSVALAVEDQPLDHPEVKVPIAFGSDEDSQEDYLAVTSYRSANWVACDYTSRPNPSGSPSFADHPNLSCQDCNTKLICLPVGGLLRPCKNPKRPHCNNGFCSATPSAACSGSVQ